MTPVERDAAILDHLKRYHLTTPEILHRLFFPGVGINPVRKVMARLCRERRIRPCRLFDQRKYFILTPREAVRLGEHRSVARPFEYQGLVNAYGVLSYCVQTGTQKFTPKEFREKFPELVIPGVRLGNYYIDVEDTSEGSQSSHDSQPSHGREAFEQEKRERIESRKEPLFELGRVVSTPGALEALTRDDIGKALARHHRGDWGDVGRHDWQENETSLSEDFRLLSIYRGTNGTKFWVITEADRSSTCVLLPSEY